MAIEQCSINSNIIDSQKRDFRGLNHEFGSQQGVARDTGMDVSPRKGDDMVGAVFLTEKNQVIAFILLVIGLAVCKLVEVDRIVKECGLS